MKNKRKTPIIKENQFDNIKKEHEKEGVHTSEVSEPVKIVILEEKKITLSNIINIVMAFLTLISVIVVIFTLFEMKTQRNASYSPSIVFNPVEITFEWDENGNESWIANENKKAESTTEINENGSISGEYHIPIVYLMESYTKYSVVNIGVGSAKNIVFKWDNNNTERLFDYLLECNAEKSDFCEIGEKSDCFLVDETLVMVDKETGIQLMYMLPEAKEAYTISLPPQYTMLINEAIKSGGMDDDNNPYLVLEISYQDVQGNTKNDLIIVLIKRTFLEENPDGSGKASYQLIQALPSDVVE